MTHQRLKELLCYDSESGVFQWISRRNKVKAGDVAGRPAIGGYIRICIDGSAHMAHRLAWFYVHGVWPAGQIDHINRKGSDNRIANLRDCTASQNQHNRSIPRSNTSGYLGVSWCKKNEKWRVQIRAKNKVMSLGHFHCPMEASNAYQAAKLQRDNFN